ncbi:glyoxylate/hydroxypyruvate reductase A [Roseofilum reptotaenium CS-1145]|uniref:Glyoxylate/hydroxypyruvate reductase A n=1 Tax=Roseofilum reptotaenium AO1-A TaxID=1925591 RepID=A0A1L9QVV9_9CYAN|nr:glyoxylate/hydroxypyruvate reductase A [Roseofilum reptotaenium]MDB9518122.1 glyoxylate/hydroxypyruvate reductase A [Roseofilum reptotaenium CS-1145]OJJ26804.1 glyoxylate/hydroxypyruvate reductase A [Roseofilum reptotaenium AO1-A]
MAVLILTEIELTDLWVSTLIAQLKKRNPDIDWRVWPECGKLEDIEIVLAWYPPPGVMQQFSNLKLIISLGAGVYHILRDPNLQAQVPIVRLIDDRLTLQMAQYVTLAVLLFQQRFFEYQKIQKLRLWESLPVAEARCFTVGILGLGVFGSTVAKKLAAIGFPVRGWSRNPKQIEGVECFYGYEQFELFLSQCQAIVCVLPVTSETKEILSNETFSALPQGAYLINVGRGQHLVEADLLNALDSGQIAGACLDVFNTEPLPHDHPFWSHPRIMVTPHIAAEGQPDNFADLILETLFLYKTGQPLKYLVDRNQGY